MTPLILVLLSELKKRMTNKVFFLFLFAFVGYFASSQNLSNEYSIMFYNVENLFDLEDDPNTEDDEFTPEGDRHWTYNRLTNKLNNISKAVLGASGWNPPELIALCEIENRNVLEMLLSKTPLQNFTYKIIHKESPDHRGIDVAFIYNEKHFYPLQYQFYSIQDNNGVILKTREIMHVNGILNNKDTLHIFVNHWPSRYEGLLETNQKRIWAAQTLRNGIDELLQDNHNAKIVVLGDFNDQPTDESITKHLEAMKHSGKVDTGKLYNLSSGWLNSEMGTMKYRSQWFVFDQIMVTGNLLKNDGGLFTESNFAKIINPHFLMEEDATHGGFKPFRTYYGYQYNGGFSDHFPVLLQLKSAD